MKAKKVTVTTLASMKNKAQKIAMITAYDASFAALANDAGADVLLVGDSLGMVVQGVESTVPVTIDEMVYHTRAVAKGNSRSLLMADMPFMSYSTKKQALHNAARLMQEGGANIVKLETTSKQISIIEVLVDAGVPVCAHLGLRPQSVNKLGGYKVQGKTEFEQQQMIKEAKGLERAGADCLLLECVPQALAKAITEMVKIPVIGIGAGVDCDGQVLVLYDILGISKGKRPSFSKDYMQTAPDIKTAICNFVDEVKKKQFPTAAHSFN